MKTLTLEQVREAGRFAWHDLGFLWLPGYPSDADDTSFSMWLPDISTTVQPDRDGGAGLWEVDTGFSDMIPIPNDDVDDYAWHHLPDCDCEFCR